MYNSSLYQVKYTNTSTVGWHSLNILKLPTVFQVLIVAIPDNTRKQAFPSFRVTDKHLSSLGQQTPSLYAVCQCSPWLEAITERLQARGNTPNYTHRWALVFN